MKKNALFVHDPYRNIDTTLAEFARAEGVPKYTVSHYYWWHKSLDGFRDRPAKGTGNGIKPHTFSYKKAFVSIEDAERISGLSYSTLKRWMEDFRISDIEEIRRRFDENAKERRELHVYETEDGRKVTITQFANEQGATFNAVSCWLSRKGTLKGFAERGHSRVNPKLIPHSGLGISKSLRGWMEYYHCTRDSIKGYIYHHNMDMNGFERRQKRGRPKHITVEGSTVSLAETARRMGVPYINLYMHYRRHGTVSGYGTNMRRGRPPKAA